MVGRAGSSSGSGRVPPPTRSAAEACLLLRSPRRTRGDRRGSVSCRFLASVGCERCRRDRESLVPASRHRLSEAANGARLSVNGGTKGYASGITPDPAHPPPGGLARVHRAAVRRGADRRGPLVGLGYVIDKDTTASDLSPTASRTPRSEARYWRNLYRSGRRIGAAR